MSLLSSPTGHLTNLSTSTAVESAAKVFRELISGPIVQAKCVACHVQGGLSGHTRLVFEPSTTLNHVPLNLKVFEDFLDAVEDGAMLILNKIQGVGHGGGVQVAVESEEFADMQRFLALLGADVAAAPITPQTLFDTVRMASTRKTLRRAALIFAGRIPTDAEYAAAERGPTALRTAIRSLMTGPEFHQFLTRGANDRLLTDRDDGEIIHHHGFVEFKREEYRRAKAAFESGNEHERWKWLNTVGYGARRAPLELIGARSGERPAVHRDPHRQLHHGEPVDGCRLWCTYPPLQTIRRTLPSSSRRASRATTGKGGMDSKSSTTPSSIWTGSSIPARCTRTIRMPAF